MRRTVSVTLKFMTESKRKAIRALLLRYRSAVNFYIKAIWHERGGLNAKCRADYSNKPGY